MVTIIILNKINLSRKSEYVSIQMGNVQFIVLNTVVELQKP